MSIEKNIGNSLSYAVPYAGDSDAFARAPDAMNFIGGAFVPPQHDNGRLPVHNPRHGAVMAEVLLSGAEDVDAAVARAELALPAWRALPVRERAQVMYRLRQLMVAELEPLTWLLSHENGKVYSEAKAEVEKAIECVEFGCSLANLAAGAQLDVSKGVNCETTHEALGVVAGVTPFNFPLMVPLWMLPQALVGGNAFILKPSERVPLSTQRLAVLMQQAGLPDGIFNIVNGGQAVVEALCDHPKIKALGFVGSTRVAKLVYGRSAATGKRALCLGGAKNHLIVVPDADVALSAENIVASFSGCAGQRCMAASVLLAVGDCEPVLNAIVEKAKTIVMGRDLGPVISAAAEARIKGYIDGAERLGAELRVDGRAASADAGGWWVGPTVLDRVSPDMPAGCEEIFGPVLSIVRVATLDEAIAIENNNPYGNASSIYTTSGAVARYVMGKVEAGMCGVNVGVPVPREPFGFGGWNDSKFGHGNMTGWDGFLFWTRPRKVTSKWAVQTEWNWMS
jgi:malonate-semialdehyde dehydrogenase (acetylating)/methylmalonate-semialdehyde dehydrogenase